jgi:hypothetical protein
MERITGPTVSEDENGAGKDGFTEGDAGLGIPPTHLTPQFFNQIQEEVANVIEVAGLALDPDNKAQMAALLRPGRDAIQTIQQGDWWVPSASPATIGTTANVGTNVSFADAATNIVRCRFSVPRSYRGVGLLFRLHIYKTGAGTGAFYIGVAAAGAENSTTNPAAFHDFPFAHSDTTDQVTVASIGLSHALLGDPSPGDLMVMAIRRQGAHTDDTSSAAMALLTMTITELMPIDIA